jgi:P-type Cu2+ transporter
MDHSHHNRHEHHQHISATANADSHVSSERHVHAAHDKHAGHHTGDFLKKFWICLILTIPVLLLSHMVQQWLGLHIRFTGDQYVLLLFGTIIFVYGGAPFLKGMVREVKDNAIGMMSLVALAITVANVYSTATD